ncbi:MAG: hypothetical protein IKN16_04845 [Selenomonadaceae bacterium]|nr:hypothetical protein [Selenomonadaceae bacterium]MBR6887752.1 hypothetical protein [Selenomonadaceae bacterium]
MESVTPERTGWRDEDISRHHRLWGIDCKATDIDFVLAEYYAKENHVHIVALIEYKNEHAKKPKIDSIQNRIYISLARRADLPFFIVIYNSDFKNFYIVSGNELARRKLSCKRRHMTEYEYVKFLYKLRDLNTIPKEVLESIGYAQTEQKQGNLFEVADL